MSSEEEIRVRRRCEQGWARRDQWAGEARVSWRQREENEGENGAGGPLRKGVWTEVKDKCKDQPRATICH